ncbi:DUF2892 domain-containing protein [Neobacillus sp. SM06]|uniref:DUF2892 domain-containing protein n=1 Tax=Neobacillus sp. SM06 TaxID=3422492 RepID=UPI003D2D8A15
MFNQLFPATATKVNGNTPDYINEAIQRKIAENIRLFKEKDKTEIKQRLEELDFEWDTERVLETNLSIITLISSIYGLTKNRAWMLVSGTASVFMIQHALQGWCPPLSLIRRLGIRTAEEIDQEKDGLKQLFLEK